MKEKICSSCAGRGFVFIGSEGDTIDCDHCSATGKITIQNAKESAVMQEVTCAISDWHDIPDYYKIQLTGINEQGERVQVLVECDTIAHALGFHQDAYIYQAFTNLFRFDRKGTALDNVKKVAHYLKWWIAREGK